MYGVCQISVVPVRSKPADIAEMVSQLLFGETYQILERRPKWTKIACTFDGYVGWIDAKQTFIIDDAAFHALKAPAYTLELVDNAVSQDYFVPLLLGSTLPNYDGIHFHLAGKRYHYNGQIIKPTEVKKSLELLFKIARRYLFAPYLWGGRSPFGIDCSGFTQNIFKVMGISLLRDASLQVQQGEVVNFFDEVSAGDLAFFENHKGKIVHVGLVLPNNQIIHASGRVRIDSFDRKGIYNHELSRYTHHLRIVKRVWDETKEN